MKNRLLFLFVFFILLTLFIITGAYYLLVFIILFLSLILISFLTMLCFSSKIQMKVIDKEDETYFIYQSKGLPIGKLKVHLNIENLFFEETYDNHFEILLGEKEISLKLPFHKDSLGKYQISKQTYILTDFLGLFEKKIKQEVLCEMIQYPQFKQVFSHMNKVSEEVITYQSNKSDDYDIREYRMGDSFKDIHYKMSYKLSNLMIKEKYKNQGNHISVYLDLSGNNESCEKVFACLKSLIENLQIYHEVCNVKWTSNEITYEYKVSDINEFNQCITKIISMPKCNNYKEVPCTWMITPSGLK